MHPSAARRGFTLVELSISLVIIGLLVGGIVVGKSMYRGAQLRSLTAEYTKYIGAIRAFRDEYRSIPGDMLNATEYFGKDNANCPADSGTASASGTCNGNGDSWVQQGAGGGQTAEMFQFWRHLQLAGYISGGYTGISGAANGYTCTANGGNCPTSRMSGAGWSANGGNVFGAWPTRFVLFTGNTLETGALTVNSWYNTELYSPQDVASIDTKLDDGKPAAGFITPRGASSCTNGSSGTDYNAKYLDNSQSKLCTIMFLAQY